MGEGARVLLVDHRSREATAVVPVPALAVPEGCPSAATVTPTASPMPVPTETYTPAPSATHTEVPTAAPSVTPTVTATPTAVPRRLSAACAARAVRAGQKRIDVVLAIDASTSMMRERTTPGGTKLDAAIDATRNSSTCCTSRPATRRRSSPSTTAPRSSRGSRRPAALDGALGAIRPRSTPACRAPSTRRRRARQRAAQARQQPCWSC